MRSCADVTMRELVNDLDEEKARSAGRLNEVAALLYALSGRFGNALTALHQLRDELFALPHTTALDAALAKLNPIIAELEACYVRQEPKP